MKPLGAALQTRGPSLQGVLASTAGRNNLSQAIQSTESALSSSSAASAAFAFRLLGVDLGQAGQKSLAEALAPPFRVCGILRPSMFEFTSSGPCYSLLSCTPAIAGSSRLLLVQVKSLSNQIPSCSREFKLASFGDAALLKALSLYYCCLRLTS